MDSSSQIRYDDIKGSNIMIILIGGATHTGKTRLAQKLLETIHYPYLSLDHLKMGLIRSGNTILSVEEDDKMTEYLWPITREMIKTNIENGQHLIVEGCYIPFHWKEDFSKWYQNEIRYVCLIMSERYIQNHYETICEYGDVIEKRLDHSIDKAMLIAENMYHLKMCKQYEHEYILIDQDYESDLDLCSFTL